MSHRQHHNRTTVGFAARAGLVMGMVLAGLYEIPEVMANDDKVFSPQFCMPVGDEGLSYSGPRRIFTSSLQNTNDEPVDYLCPLVRDNLNGGIAKVWVRLNNNENEPTEFTECCLYSFDPLGQSADFECQRADVDKGRQSLEITGVKSWTNGYYVLRCTLEYGDEIFSYRSSEP